MIRSLITRRLFSSECSLEAKGFTRVITLTRPKMKNALGESLVAELEAAINLLETDHQARALLIKSGVPGVFCAGADLKERIEMPIPKVNPFVDRLRNLFERIAKLKYPTIAFIDGIALGGGLELAMACDLRYGTKNAKLGVPESKLAIFPAAGGTQRMPQLIGIAKAKELIFTGRIIDVHEAQQIGLINRLLSGESEVNDVIATITNNGPIAIKLAKELMECDMSKGLANESALYGKLLRTQDRQEGLLSFKEKRAPLYKGA